MRGSYIKTFLVIGVAACGLAGSLSTKAQIAVDGTGSALLDFTSAPPSPSSFSTVSVGASSATYEMIAAFDTQLMTTVAASVNQPLGTTATAGTAALARHNTASGSLQTDPTGVDYNVLMATLMNNAGSTITEFKLTYDHSIPVAPLAAGEMIPGHRVFFSTTGLAGSWQPVPSLSGLVVATPGANATITGISWDAGTTAYIIWGDDNNVGNPDAVNAIDNFVISDVVAGPSLPPSITTQPVSVSVNERQVATLSVVAGGAGLTYQWFLSPATAIPGATRASYAVTNRLATSRYPWSIPTDSGTYYVVVSGTAGPPVTSGNATVTVTADTTRPTMLYATCGPAADQITVELSEPLDDSTQGVTDPFIWQIRDMLGGPGLQVASVVYTDNGISTSLLFNIDPSTPRDLNKGYIVGLDPGGTPPFDTAKTPNSLSLASAVGARCFTNTIVYTNQAWRYNDADVDPGATWQTSGFDDSAAPWVLGIAPFDGKRDGGMASPDGLDDCRAATLYGLGPVATCIRMQSPVTLTNGSSYYFRTHFNYSGNLAKTFLHLNGKVDDGAAVYLNGTQIWQIRYANGLTHAQFTGNGVPVPATVGDTDPQDTLNLPTATGLINGNNVLAIIVKQGNLTSSDVTMGMAVSTLSAVPHITLSIVDNGNGTVNVSWSPVIGTLKSSPSPTAALSTWSTVGTTSPQTVSKAGLPKFFAVQGPAEP